MDERLETLAQRTGQWLRTHGWRLATAESYTGGWIAETVTAIAGSSDWFGCGWVTYSNAAKVRQLDVPATLIDAQGAVSEAATTGFAFAPGMVMITSSAL